MQNPSPNTGRTSPPVSRAGESPVTPKQPPGRVAGPTLPTPPPLFRRTDWVTFVLVTLLTMAGYLYTIAPDLTLEDSGELAVASMYAGVPHPPGYPVWTLYTYAFTKLLPFSNIAWRVSVSSERRVPSPPASIATFIWISRTYFLVASTRSFSTVSASPG